MSDEMNWQPIEKAPYGRWLLVWLHLPKNPAASMPVIAQRVCIEQDEPESYGERRRTVGCWWANGRYYAAGHVSHWMALPEAPSGA